MAKYEVTVVETLSHFVTVEAETREQAILKGHNIVLNGPDDQYQTYSHGAGEIAALKLEEVID